MDLSNLKPASGSVHNSKRIGRGQGSGKGGTSTKGHKGQKSRTGYSRKIGFEGGQMPLQRRVPKGGFINPHRVEYASINLDLLQRISEEKGISTITAETLREGHLIGKKELFKVLGRGELKSKLEVHAHAFSATAKEAIEKLGGTATTI